MTADDADWATDMTAFRDERDTPDRGPFARQFAFLTKNLLDATSVADVLEQVVLAVYRVIPGVDLVSITLRSPDGAFHTPAETESLATRLGNCSTRRAKAPA